MQSNTQSLTRIQLQTCRSRSLGISLQRQRHRGSQRDRASERAGKSGVGWIAVYLRLYGRPALGSGRQQQARSVWEETTTWRDSTLSCDHHPLCGILPCDGFRSDAPAKAAGETDTDPRWRRPLRVCMADLQRRISTVPHGNAPGGPVVCWRDGPCSTAVASAAAVSAIDEADNMGGPCGECEGSVSARLRRIHAACGGARRAIAVDRRICRQVCPFFLRRSRHSSILCS